MKKFIAITLLSFLSACSQKAAYISACEKATFAVDQCNFLWDKRQTTIGINGPLIGGIVGINIP